MTLYTVHIYREMRLTFERIEAGTPEAAAAIARDRLTEEADDIEDCDGEDLTALIDVVGDDQFERSVTMDFEAERLRKSVPALLEALTWLATAAEDLDAAIDGVTDEFNIERAELEGAIENARAAIAKAAAIHQPTLERTQP